MKTTRKARHKHTIQTNQCVMKALLTSLACFVVGPIFAEAPLQMTDTSVVAFFRFNSVIDKSKDSGPNKSTLTSFNGQSAYLDGRHDPSEIWQSEYVDICCLPE